MTKKYVKKKLPQPNATFRDADQSRDFTPSDILGMICNPIYAGMGPYPALVSDEQWVAAATAAIEKEGAEQFLVNLLYLLRETFQEESD